MQQRQDSQPPLVVYTIVERHRDSKKLWVRIGSAFRNRDGSLNATLDAVPTNGSLHIRELRPANASAQTLDAAE